VKLCSRRPARPLPIWVILAFLAAVPLQAQSGEKTGTLRGTVVNFITRTPIARALVTSNDQRLAALTDADGRFEFQVPLAAADGAAEAAVPQGFFLSPRRPGYLAVDVRDGIQPHGPGDDIVLYLVPEAIIAGRITVAGPEALPPVNVEIVRRQVQDGRIQWVPAGSVTARSDGEFRFAELAAGSYKVLTREALDNDTALPDRQAQIYGFPPAYAQNAPDFAGAAVLQIVPGMTATANLTLTRKPYHRIHIPVANATADTVIAVNVSVGGQRGQGFSLGYNNRGQAIEGLLPDGIYTVEANGFGTGPGSGTLTFTVNGGPVNGPAMTLVPDSLIRVVVNEEFTSTDDSGSVSFSDGRRTIRLKGPRRYMSVVLQSAEETPGSGAALRDPVGQGDEGLVIEDVHPGRYWIRVNTTRGYAASIRSGGIDLRREPLVIAPGASPAPIEITMRDDTAVISGTIEGMPPAPPVVSTPALNAARVTPAMQSPARVYCIPAADSGGQYTEAWVSPEGSFVSAPLPPGAYRVLAFDHAQQLEYRNPEAMQAYDSRGPLVQVAGGQKEQVRVPLIVTTE